MFKNIKGDLSNLKSDENIEWVKRVILGEIIPEKDLNSEQADLVKQLSLREVFGLVRKNRDVRVQRNKLIYDRYVMAAKFKKGDTVWLKNKQIKKGECKKFIFSWKGPYIVIKNINNINYIVKPLFKNKGRPITVNRVRLKKHFGSHDQSINEENEESVHTREKRVGTWQSKRAKQIVEKAKKTRKNKSIGNDRKSKEGENVKGLLQPELAPVIDLQNLTSNGQTAQDENIKVKHRTTQKTKQSEEEKEDTTFKNKKKIDDTFAPDRPVRNRKKPDWFRQKEK
ncbi:Retrovirus-related Pol poly from transposon [Brachionus plicatilis]|uniref:Retrovirus-related Pol poly from transposon n=1 Tax=Brachionus plicatilis TaxID=10195 RepID=A0A3M7SBR2_BRAPC|nr:Retrovirus-related Pol poly from transposon [Brachionus plicatilis]